jgi:hypothetical protein
MEHRMKRVACIALCGIVLIAGVAAAACGGGGDDNDATPAATGSPANNDVPTPFPTPMLNGNEITSDSKGYAATLPDGWTPKFNLISTTNGSADVYFEPQRPGAPVQANIAVTCIIGDAPPVEERAVGEQTAVARLGLNENISVDTVRIAGEDATAIHYVNTSQQNPDQPHLDKVDIILDGPACAYKVTTTTLEGERAQYQPIFDAFIQSFRLLG